jgi:uncharacterized protein (TIGR01777 family)
VLLSGAHGLIGRALADRLAVDGHTVVRLQRPSAGGPGAGGPGAGGPGAGGPDGDQARVAYDPAGGWLDRPALESHGPYDGVVHLAGAGIGDRRWSTGRRREIRTSRTSATALVATAVTTLEPRPQVMVSASAIGWYGNRGEEELTEDSGPGEGFLAEVCRDWEEAARPAAAAGIRLVLLRSGIVLSPTGGALRRQLALFTRGLGGRVGHGRQYMSLITLRDEVEVIVRALHDESLSGPLNAVAPQPLTNAEFTAALGRALHRPTVLSVPAPALRLALGRAMADELLLASQRVRPARLLAVGHRFADPDPGAALPALLGRVG